MSYTLADLNKQQRHEMIMLGFNPLDPGHIEYYLSGADKPTKQMIVENINRMGGKKLNLKPTKNHKFEREINVNELDRMVGTDADNVDKMFKSTSTSSNPRDLIKEQMESYSKPQRNMGQNRFNRVEGNQSNLDGVTEQNAESLFIQLNKLFKSGNTSFNEWLSLFNILKETLTDIKNSNNKEQKLQTLDEIKNEFLKSI